MRTEERRAASPRPSLNRILKTFLRISYGIAYGTAYDTAILGGENDQTDA